MASIKKTTKAIISKAGRTRVAESYKLIAQGESKRGGRVGSGRVWVILPVRQQTTHFELNTGFSGFINCLSDLPVFSVFISCTHASKAPRYKLSSSQDIAIRNVLVAILRIPELTSQYPRGGTVM